MANRPHYPDCPPPLPELHWAPYQEFGIPDPAEEEFCAPSGAITIAATGFRDNDIIIYWERPAT
jgi:hypothetical protein